MKMQFKAIAFAAAWLWRWGRLPGPARPRPRSGSTAIPAIHAEQRPADGRDEVVHRRSQKNSRPRA